MEVLTRDNKYIVIRVSEDKVVKGRFKIQLEPPFKIVNSLPKHIYVQLLNDHKETTQTFKMLQQTVIEDFKHSLYRRVYMRVLLDGFFWSSEHHLYPDPQKKEKDELTKEDCIFKIPLLDSNDQTLSLLCYEPWRL